MRSNFPFHLLCENPCTTLNQARDYLKRNNPKKNLKEVDDDGWTPLHCAIHAQNFILALYLLRKGADADTVTKRDGNALHFLCSLRTSTLGETEREDFSSLLKLITDKGADINFQKSCTKSTPLHEAVGKNSILAAEFLLKRGCKMNIKDNLGETALDTAVRFNRTEVLRLMMTFNPEEEKVRMILKHCQNSEVVELFSAYLKTRQKEKRKSLMKGMAILPTERQSSFDRPVVETGYFTVKTTVMFTKVLASNLELTASICQSGQQSVSNSSKVSKITERLQIQDIMLGVLNSERKLLEFFNFTLQSQLNSFKSATILWRENSPFTQLISQYMKKNGQSYLSKAIIPEIKAIYSLFHLKEDRSDLVQTVQGSPLSERGIDSSVVIKVVSSFLSKILSSMDLIPLSIRALMTLISHLTSEKFPSMKEQAVANFFFLRFLNPALISPEQYGFPALSSHMQKLMIKVTKIIQNIVNDAEYHEQVMKDFTQVNELFRDKLVLFIHELSYTSNHSLPSAPSTDNYLVDFEYDRIVERDDLNEVYCFLQKNTSISQSLTGVNLKVFEFVMQHFGQKVTTNDQDLFDFMWNSV